MLNQNFKNSKIYQRRILSKENLLNQADYCDIDTIGVEVVVPPAINPNPTITTTKSQQQITKPNDKKIVVQTQHKNHIYSEIIKHPSSSSSPLVVDKNNSVANKTHITKHKTIEAPPASIITDHRTKKMEVSEQKKFNTEIVGFVEEYTF